MGDISLELWMERRKLAALENALTDQGMSVTAYMQAQLEKAYQAFVPQETQQFIQAEIMPSLFKGVMSTRTWVTQSSLGYNSLETSKFLRPKRIRLIFAAFI